MNIGDILTKETYTQGAIWCNQNDAHIEMIAGQYTIVANAVIVPTTAEQIAQIDAQYEADKDELKSYYTEFLMRGDTEGQQAIKDELTALDTQYDADIAALNEEV